MLLSTGEDSIENLPVLLNGPDYDDEGASAGLSAMLPPEAMLLDCGVCQEPFGPDGDRMPVVLAPSTLCMCLGCATTAEARTVGGRLHGHDALSL